MRKPVAAGGFYPADRSELVSEIERCFLSPFGPGALPELGEGELKAVIVPHAGYSFSGPIAAHAYYEIAKAGLFDTYVILGTNHTGFGLPISISPENWRTPLGEVELDEELADGILKSSEVAEYDRYAHYAEHSIEVQLPFLQYLHARFDIPFKFVPISVGTTDLSLLRQLAEGIWKEVEKAEKKVLVIASSDLNHVGAYYGLIPPKGKSAPEYGKELDGIVLKEIEELDEEGVLEVTRDRGMTVCGVGPICTSIIYSKRAGAKGARVLRYATSYDVSGDPTVSVGYSAVAFR